MRLTPDQIPALLDDLGAANAELKALALQTPAHWTRGPAGRWTLAQHVEHVGMMLAITARRLEEAVARLRAGGLGRRPFRGPLEALFVALATGRRFPRGGRAIPEAIPGGTLERDVAFAGLDDGLRRHRAVAQGLTREEQGRIWFRNPFIRLRWHYTLPEILRVQANHTRHHARLAAEGLVAAGAALPAPRAGAAR